ncbi:MAG: DUF1387 domain-containing protein [Actinomycetota bacterium]|nr:DUF1387 domain-containing protein [Actinomycetota bacterium]
MRTLLTLLAALACGAMMLVCARMMAGRRDRAAPPAEEQLAELREEIARLRAERMLGDREERIDG